MTVAIERSARAQLSTARWVLGQFGAQLAEFAGMNREARRTERGRDLAARMQVLNEGREKWLARADELEARVNAEDSND